MYEAPRELVGASGAALKEMPRHAETGLCCGAGGARMWMEEHIGKRVNLERVDEALTTVSDGAKIATGCPFCRVMMTDGLTDRQDEGKGAGVEVLDVAQLLLAAIDTSTVTLPPKKKPEQTKPEKPAAPAAAAPAAAPSAPAAADTTQKEVKPVTGLGIAGGAKRPGANKAAPAAAAPAAPAEAAPPKPTEAAPVKGLGMAAGAKRPGAGKATPAAEGAGATEPASTATEPNPPRASRRPLPPRCP